MRYLISLAPETVADEDVDKWAPPGEPVVPWFPSTLENVFLSTISFKRVPTAQIVEDPNLDLDAIAVRLKAEYTGLPATLHDNYVLATARAAYSYPVGTVMQVYISADEAKLKVVGHETYHVLWDKQPL